MVGPRSCLITNSSTTRPWPYPWVVRVLHELAALLRLSGFQRLFSVRLASQSADGLFQVGLATLFFFAPERQNSATQVALAFTVLLLPFTLVGPWAGVFLDRWRRRQVLLVGNILRAGLAVVIALLMLATPVGQPLPWLIYVLALAVLSVNRFLLSALSAGLPLVVDGPLLLTANSLLPTLGAIAAGVGAAGGLLLGLFLPAGRLQDAGAVVVAALLMALASALAARLGASQLGPDRSEPLPALTTAVKNILSDLLAGARYLAQRGTPGQALVIMSFHRFLFGVTLVASILMSRNYLTLASDTSAGLDKFAVIAAATGAGFGLAVLLTPFLSYRCGQRTWIVSCLVLGGVAQGLISVHVSLTSLILAGTALGLSAQGAKIAVDTIVQRDTADAFRGRAFALYDVLYNAGFIGAAALAALTLPDSGYSRTVFIGLAACYGLVAITYGLRGVRNPRPVHGVHPTM